MVDWCDAGFHAFTKFEMSLGESCKALASPFPIVPIFPSSHLSPSYPSHFSCHFSLNLRIGTPKTWSNVIEDAKTSNFCAHRKCFAGFHQVALRRPDVTTSRKGRSPRSPVGGMKGTVAVHHLQGNSLRWSWKLQRHSEKGKERKWQKNNKQKEREERKLCKWPLM